MPEMGVSLRLPSNVTAERAAHILHGDTNGGGHSPRTGHPGKSHFPGSWSDQTILDKISEIALDPTLPKRPSYQGRLIVEGVRSGVQVRVVVDRNGRVITGFPL